jgi:formylmethanofuran:tetrahydromethanopterin formyltransferase
MDVLSRILERLGLTLNEAKTKIVNTFEGKFDFLGFSIWMGKSIRTGNHYPHAQPSKKSLHAIKDRVTALTKREGTLVPLDLVVGAVSATPIIPYICRVAPATLRGYRPERSDPCPER